METLFGLIAGVTMILALMAMKSRFTGFRSERPKAFATQGPALDLRRHLNGPILCEGVIYGPTGRVSSRFVADMRGEWDGNTGRLHETFRYDSGEVQERCWTLRLGNDGRILATAPDVVGDGTGTASGPAVQMRYRIKLDQKAGGHVLDVVDWMYLMENGTIMNRSQFTKFGLKVAELVVNRSQFTKFGLKVAELVATMRKVEV